VCGSKKTLESRVYKRRIFLEVTWAALHLQMYYLLFYRLQVKMGFKKLIKLQLFSKCTKDLNKKFSKKPNKKTGFSSKAESDKLFTEISILLSTFHWTA
jgi:hypothetical protein